MLIVTARLNMDLEVDKPEIAPGRLYERFLSGHKRVFRFFPISIRNVSRSQETPSSSRFATYPVSSYANIRGLSEFGYKKMSSLPRCCIFFDGSSLTL